MGVGSYKRISLPEAAMCRNPHNSSNLRFPHSHKRFGRFVEFTDMLLLLRIGRPIGLVFLDSSQDRI